MADHVQVAGEPVPFEQALAVVVGYCLGTEPVRWRTPRSGVGDPVDPVDLGAFAYGSYDCVPGSPGAALEPIDILVADGLNGQMRARDIAAALAVSGQVSDCLADIPDDLCFWELSRREVSEQPESHSDRAWPLWRAWTILISAPGIELARSHKILHHKRPKAFPLLDNETIGYMSTDPWGAIHDDLLATADEWEALEEQVNSHLAKGEGCVPLARLRLHDIVLWCSATGRTDEAEGWGTAILDVSG